MAKSMMVSAFGQTHPGRVRKENEDSLYYRKLEKPELVESKGCLLIVADGMGGHLAGEVASEMAIRVTTQHYYANANDAIGHILKDAIQKANYRIKVEADTDAQRQGMGTTITAAVIQGDQAYIANVGDSRTYIIQKNSIRQITRDHSLVSELGLSASEARRSAYRNQITRALGKDYHVDIDLFEENLQDGDILLLCSDGLIGHVDDEEILKVVRGSKLEQVPGYLIKLACDRGGTDNITVVVAQVGAGNPSRLNGNGKQAQNGRATLVIKKKKPDQNKWLVVVIIILILLLLSIGAYFLLGKFLDTNTKSINRTSGITHPEGRMINAENQLAARQLVPAKLAGQSNVALDSINRAYQKALAAFIKEQKMAFVVFDTVKKKTEKLSSQMLNELPDSIKEKVDYVHKLEEPVKQLKLLLTKEEEPALKQR